jgi:peptidoglycan hydrolase CwlO-like protein
MAVTTLDRKFDIAKDALECLAAAAQNDISDLEDRVADLETTIENKDQEIADLQQDVKYLQTQLDDLQSTPEPNGPTDSQRNITLTL